MAEMLLSGAILWADAAPEPRRAWLLLRDGVVARVGAPDEPEPPAAERVALDGHHVLPGFVDAHTHLSVSAFRAIAGDARAWRSREDALRAVAEAASRAAPDAWLLFLDLDLAAWRGNRLPSPEALAEAAGGRPLLAADVTLHRGVASESGLARAEVAGRQVDRDRDVERDRAGRPSGLVWEAAFARVLRRALADMAAALHESGFDALLAREAERHLRLGIVRAHDPGVPAGVAARLQALAARTPLRLSWSAGSPDGLLVPPPPPSGAPESVDGPPSTKLFTDGAHRCALCLPAGLVVRAGFRAVRAALRGDVHPLRELLADPVRLVGRELQVPHLRFDDAGLAACARPHAASGRRLRIHALGNLAVRQTTELLRAMRPDGGATIEHLLVLTEADCDRVAASGAAVTVQPGFLPGYGRALLERGVGGALRALPVASLVARGVPLAISSDNPCAPLDPLANLRLAVSRRLDDGTLVDPREALTRSAAVYAASAGGARAIGDAQASGIAPGAPADLAICDGDPFAPTTRVVATWIGGRRVWAGGDQAGSLPGARQIVFASR